MPQSDPVRVKETRTPTYQTEVLLPAEANVRRRRERRQMPIWVGILGGAMIVIVLFLACVLLALAMGNQISPAG